MIILLRKKIAYKISLKNVLMQAPLQPLEALNGQIKDRDVMSKFDKGEAYIF